jgi:hypothetical protein
MFANTAITASSLLSRFRSPMNPLKIRVAVAGSISKLAILPIEAERIP